MYETMLSAVIPGQYGAHTTLEALLKPPGTVLPRNYVWMLDAYGTITLRCAEPLHPDILSWEPVELPPQGGAVLFYLCSPLRTNQRVRERRADGVRRKRPLTDPQACERWLDIAAPRAGLHLIAPSIEISHAWIGKPNRSFILPVTVFHGMAVVDDVDRLRAAMLLGIGNAKAFGFGFLSVYDVETPLS